MEKMIKKIVTLGPSTNTIEILEKIKERVVDFVRINMSHSTLKDLKYFIELSQKVGLDFIIDTEGSQIRTCEIKNGEYFYYENHEILLYEEEIIGGPDKISLRPKEIFQQLNVDDILYIDFDTLVLSVVDVSTKNKGFIKAKVISQGILGSNKGVVVDKQSGNEIVLPPLTSKDFEAIKIGQKYNVNFIAFSFARNKEAIEYVRNVSGMKVISKIECVDALKNLEEIIEVSDYLLIDRGDLSKEIPIEKIPLTQRVILSKAKNMNKEVFVATNLLESMIHHRKPTRAEVHDIIETINEGANGLVLAAETAIGKYPLGCINMLNKLILHSKFVEKKIKQNEEITPINIKRSYLLEHSVSSNLIEPNGGILVNRIGNPEDFTSELSDHKIKLNENTQLDFEQISIGTYSPLEGFLTKEELNSVLDNLRLPEGAIWPIPILLDVDYDIWKKLSNGELVPLVNSNSDEVVGMIEVGDLYEYDPLKIALKFYGTTVAEHPGVAITASMSGYYIGGKVTLFSFSEKKFKYSFTPRQIRRLFEEKNWEKVVGFHTRNVIHKAHEFIQFEAIKRAKADGILLHPVVGKKKKGDYQAQYIIESYEYMIKNVYPPDTALLAVFSTYSRYGGAKEALFTALCRQNFGCSHFVVGRDHTGAGISTTNNSGSIFDKFPDLKVKIIKFDEVFFSKLQNKYIEKTSEYDLSDKLSISGTEARKILLRGDNPPEWFMREEIASIITTAIKKGVEVFVK